MFGDGQLTFRVLETVAKSQNKADAAEMYEIIGEN
jgi:hypothetical protein